MTDFIDEDITEWLEDEDIKELETKEVEQSADRAGYQL